MDSWHNGRLTNWQVDKLASWHNDRLTKWRSTDQMSDFFVEKNRNFFSAFDCSSPRSRSKRCQSQHPFKKKKEKRYKTFSLPPMLQQNKLECLSLTIYFSLVLCLWERTWALDGTLLAGVYIVMWDFKF